MEAEVEELEKSIHGKLRFQTPEKNAVIIKKFNNGAISWTHSSNAHVHPSSGAVCMIFGRTLRLFPYFMCANSDGSGETVRMRRLAWAFAGRLCDKYHNLMSWLIVFFLP